MNNEDLVVALIFIIAFFTLGCITGIVTTEESFQSQAVEHGYAHYEITTGKWMWNNDVKDGDVK